MLILMLSLSLLCLVGYLLYLIIPTITFYLRLGIKHINPFIDESIDIPEYEPAIMSYLVNFQKIGRREICSTLFDLIAKKEIKIEMTKGFVNDDTGKYQLILVNYREATLNSYEEILVKYLFGRKKTIIVGVIILFVAFFLGCIATEKTKVLLYFTMGLAGIGWATINVNSYPMVVEMSKGSNVGKYTGYYYTASMFAQIITPVLSGVFMDLAGTMRVLFPYSCVFCVLAFCTMIFVKHGDYKPETKKGLEALDVDD